MRWPFTYLLIFLIEYLSKNSILNCYNWLVTTNSTIFSIFCASGHWYRGAANQLWFPGRSQNHHTKSCGRASVGRVGPSPCTRLIKTKSFCTISTKMGTNGLLLSSRVIPRYFAIIVHKNVCHFLCKYTNGNLSQEKKYLVIDQRDTVSVIYIFLYIYLISI